MSPVFDGPLVSTQWLADHLGSPTLVVIDATVRREPDGTFRSGREAHHGAGHIPGAQFTELLHGCGETEPASILFARPDAGRLAAEIARLGLGAESRVVVYDSDLGQWAARFWWLLRSAGLESVAVLDGGLTAWLGEHRSVETGTLMLPADPRPAFIPVPRPELWAGPELMGAALDGSRPATLISAVPREQFRPPGAGAPSTTLNIPLATLMSGTDHTLLPEGRLRELYAPALASGLPIISYCAAGIEASANALGLAVLGARDVRVFDGSLESLAA
ncbi:sulfurtransferase [Mycetocola spongiae]|uniref:sulfurtransferase n=1 Tax=Mycetocola spongiae TaxID=2859226 RepID=UPI001CF19A87|nr:rhodanese-like domain-containing protein [Mycetocola spongiae]UCR88920.1 hypothetical protein KXZ72_13375 [Mycetocola spongiae]